MKGTLTLTADERARIVEHLQSPSDHIRRAPKVPEAIQTLAAYSWCLLVIIAGVVVLAYVLIYLRLIVLPVVVALFLTTLLSPLVERLRKRGWKRGRATAAVLAGVLIVLTALISILAPQVSSEIGEMGTAVRGGADRALEYLAKGPLQLSQKQIDSFIDRAAGQLAQNRERIASGLISGAIKVGEFITGALLTAFLLFFFLKDGYAMWSWFTGQFDEPAKGHFRNIGKRALMTMGSYLHGIAIVGLIEGTAIGIVLFILGIPLLVPLVLLQFFAAFFPIVGALVAGTVATLVALVSGGLTDALIMAIAILVIQQADNHLLQPLIMGRAVKLHPVVVILSLAAGGIVGGIVGALFAVPLAAVASAIGNYLNGLRDINHKSFAELQPKG
jgi:predicted PurR-regulated permease PerM